MILRLRLLGRPRIDRLHGGTSDDTLRGSKRVALLAVLAAWGGGRPVPRDSALTILWGEDAAMDARATLRQLLTAVRREVDDGVIASVPPDGLALDPERVTCDVWEFEQAAVLKEWERACGLYRGDFLGGTDHDLGPSWRAWVESVREGLARRATDAHWQWAKALEQEGRSRAAIRAARRAVELEPWCERGVRELIRMLLRAGDRSAALLEYRDFSRRMEEEFGAAPSPETREVVAHL